MVEKCPESGQHEGTGSPRKSCQWEVRGRLWGGLHRGRAELDQEHWCFNPSAVVVDGARARNPKPD